MTQLGNSLLLALIPLPKQTDHHTSLGLSFYRAVYLQPSTYRAIYLGSSIYRVSIVPIHGRSKC